MPATKSKRAPREALLPRQQIAQLAGLRPVHHAFAWFRKHEEALVQLQLELAAIPAPPFGEAARSAWFKQKFQGLGLATQVDEAGNVIAARAGADSELPAVALIAHMDTVFPEGTPLKYRSEGGKLYGPGISDNGSGLVALLALAESLRWTDVRNRADIIFVCTVGEEGEGNLRGVRHLFANGEWRQKIGYAIIVDGAGTETIVSQALGSRRFEITVRGKGGHSWSDFGEPNPIAVLARAICDLYKIEVSTTARKKSAYNVGVIEGGTSVNSIPEAARMRVDIRSESQSELERLEHELRAAVARAVRSVRAPSKAEAAGKPALQCEIESIGERPAAELASGARILQVMRAVDAHLGIDSRLHCSSTDANIPLALGKEALSIGAGGSGGGAHTLKEWYDPAGRDLGLKRILLATLAIAGVED
ncbi:MAG TPA: M20/M25/M40 family metallo-hydrolase [Terriglobales bacterium]|nr:M20/M25/M40 family metallo-hydrolase [Terriglobales bacterium]